MLYLAIQILAAETSVKENFNFTMTPYDLRLIQCPYRLLFENVAISAL